MTHFYRPARKPYKSTFDDIETLAITMWGYHPSLWTEAASERMKERLRDRARRILYEMDAVPPRFTKRDPRDVPVERRQPIVIAPAKRELRKAADRS